jgi:hypothetical protein
MKRIRTVLKLLILSTIFGLLLYGVMDDRVVVIDFW